MSIKTELDPFFFPQSVAVVGVSTTFAKWGAIILHNIILGEYKGKLYPVHPREKELFGHTTYPSIGAIPGPVDLVVIIVPTNKVIDILDEAGKKGIRAAVIITAGYSETGRKGRLLEEETVRFAGDRGIRIVGPNCMGIVSLDPMSFVSWMPSFIPNKGSVSVISQSGNMGYSISKSVSKRGMGIARVISIGNEADVSTSELIDFLAQDDETTIILLYIEGVDDGTAFSASLKRATARKPVIAIKSGSTAAGARAGASHTGAMAGSDEIFSSILRSGGAIRAREIDEMTDYAAAFSSQPIPSGRRIGIITLGGGWGVMAADALETCGLQVTPLKDETIERLNDILPPYWSRNNPVDLVAGLKDGDFKKPLSILLESDYIDALMLLGIGYGNLRGKFFINSPYSHLYDMKEIGTLFVNADETTAEAIISMIDVFKKPIIPVVDQNVIDEKNRFKEILGSRGILLYPSPLRGAVALSGLVRYGEYLRNKAIS